uniref:Uncharacterized protein n=1 Tax=Ditylenchus dipsaci TaxID=166011 RepID=A0A915DWM4_9BILA
MEDLQAHHTEELEQQRVEYERQLRVLKQRMEHEEVCKRKLQEELQTISSSNIHSNEHKLAELKASYEETIKELRSEFDNQLDKLKREHKGELDDEKQATRLALDAVHRMHEEELKIIQHKLQACQKQLKEHQCPPPLQSSSAIDQGTEAIAAREQVNGDSDQDSSAHSKITVDKISAELNHLSALYSAKCLENSQLDEKMQLLLQDKDNQAAISEVDTHNRRLQRELRHKETSIEELKQRITWLERKLNSCGVELTEQELLASCSSHSPWAKPSRTRSRPPRSTPVPEPDLIPQQTKRSDNGGVGGLRKLAPNRRNDVRYHSNPVIPVLSLSNAALHSTSTNDDFALNSLSSTIAISTAQFHIQPTLLPNTPPTTNFVDDMRRSLAVSGGVSERRKFFERVAEYNTSF